MTEKKKSMAILAEIVEEIVAASGLSLVSLKLAGARARKQTIEITIHRQAGRVSLDDCENINRTVDKKIESLQDPDLPTSSETLALEELFGDRPYEISVQSPGIERVLKENNEFELFKGEHVALRLVDSLPVYGYSLSGELGGLDKEGRIIIASPCPDAEPNSKKAKAGKKSSAAKTATKKESACQLSVDSASAQNENFILIERNNLKEIRLSPQYAKFFAKETGDELAAEAALESP